MDKFDVEEPDGYCVFTGVARCRLRGKFLNAAAVLIQLGILKDIDVCHSGKCES